MTLVEAWHFAFVRDDGTDPGKLREARSVLYEAALRIVHGATANLSVRGTDRESLEADALNAWFLRRLDRSLDAGRAPQSDLHVRMVIRRSLRNEAVSQLRDIAKAQGRTGSKPTDTDEEAAERAAFSMSSPLSPRPSVAVGASENRVEAGTVTASMDDWDARVRFDLDGPGDGRSATDEIVLEGRRRVSRLGLAFESVGEVVVRLARPQAVANRRMALDDHGHLMRARTTLADIYEAEDSGRSKQARNRVNQRHRRLRVDVEKRRDVALRDERIEPWQHAAMPDFVAWMASPEGLASWADDGEPVILPGHEVESGSA